MQRDTYLFKHEILNHRNISHGLAFTERIILRQHNVTWSLARNLERISCTQLQNLTGLPAHTQKQTNKQTSTHKTNKPSRTKQTISVWRDGVVSTLFPLAIPPTLFWEPVSYQLCSLLQSHPHCFESRCQATPVNVSNEEEEDLSDCVVCLLVWGSLVA